LRAGKKGTIHDGPKRLSKAPNGYLSVSDIKTLELT